MWMLDLINKKKQNQQLTTKEIDFIISGFTKGDIPDYQMSAFLMTVWFNGLNNQETFDLTKSLINSGDSLDLSSISGFKADKHSTGGVGDKISLLYAPLLASFGIKVAKISGRGLEQTGGTIDKLEAIPNFNVNLQWNDFLKVINECGMSIISQTQDFTPADKKVYALRDTTGTVDSIPLIAASIMAKKIAMGSDGLVLDVKCGNGAFMSNLNDAKKLARLMLQIAQELKVKTAVIISDMNQPLGRMIGNICEVYEAYEFLQGKNQDSALLELVTSLSAISLLQAEICSNFDEAKQKCIEQLKSLAPLNIFKQFIKQQSGDIDFVTNFVWKDAVKFVIEIKASVSGFVNFHNCYGLGNLAMHLGAGRETNYSSIDYMAGIFINKKTQEKVNANETVLTLYTNINNVSEFKAMAKELFTIEQSLPLINNIIYEIMQ